MFWWGLLVLMLWGEAAWSEPELRVEVDFQSVDGELRTLSGVQGSPYPMAPGDVPQVELYRQFAIGLCRFPQDCEPNTLTLSGLFPNARAAPQQPSSYHFERIDAHIRAAREAGCRILWQTSYDVGGTDRWVGLNLGGQAPRDLELWGQVVRRCLEHFNHGWKDGFRETVEMVEFVNEPDGLGGFTGPERQRLVPAFLFFLRVLQTHNQIHPEFPVAAVGPGIPLSWDQWERWRGPLRHLLAEMKRENLKLEVFSFHTYGRQISPRDNRLLAQALRSELDAAGLRQTRLMNSEWQGGDYLRTLLGVPKVRTQVYDERQIGLFREGLATYAVACKIAWQGVVDESCYYLAKRRCVPSTVQTAGLDVATLFAPPDRANPLAYQERLWERLARETPLRCRTRDLYAHNIYALGLRSRSGSARGLLLANLRPRAQDLRLLTESQPLRSTRTVGVTGQPGPEVVDGRLKVPALTTLWIPWP